MFKLNWFKQEKPDPADIKNIITSQQKLIDTQKRTINSLHSENKRLIGIIEKLLEGGTFEDEFQNKGG